MSSPPGNSPLGRSSEGAAVRVPHVPRRLLALTVGPALVVMLADTEAGSVIAAAQSGAEWGCRLVLPQFLLTPALFMAQELAGRLGITTRQGLAELVLRRLGRLPAIVLLAALVMSCTGALVTELSGIAGVGELFRIPVWQTATVAAAGLIAIVWTGSYRSVELVAIAVGLCELAFIVLAWLAHPSASTMLAQSVQVPLGDRGYLYLLAANLGTCVIPWAIFYQQSASIDKGLIGPTWPPCAWRRWGVRSCARPSRPLSLWPPRLHSAMDRPPGSRSTGSATSPMPLPLQSIRRPAVWCSHSG